MKQEEFEKNVSLYIDGELHQDDIPEFLRYLDISRKAKEYYDKQLKLKDAMKSLAVTQNQDEKFNEYWPSLSRKIGSGIGWILLIIGLVANIGYALYIFAINTDIKPFEKITAFLIISGFSLLLINVGYQRFKESRVDKYKDVMK